MLSIHFEIKTFINITQDKGQIHESINGVSLLATGLLYTWVLIFGLKWHEIYKILPIKIFVKRYKKLLLEKY